MALAEMPIAVVMERRAPVHPWDEARWRAVRVLAWRGPEPTPQGLDQRAGEDPCLVAGLRLTLHANENDGYFENWVAPEPKVFVMWQTRGSQAIPVQASVSYAEGTRMLDSGDSADGLPMPPEVHEWLAAYLRQHYRPKPRRGRAHG
jgi:hypothetical protein